MLPAGIRHCPNFDWGYEVMKKQIAVFSVSLSFVLPGKPFNGVRGLAVLDAPSFAPREGWGF